MDAETLLQQLTAKIISSPMTEDAKKEAFVEIIVSIRSCVAPVLVKYLPQERLDELVKAENPDPSIYYRMIAEALAGDNLNQALKEIDELTQRVIIAIEKSVFSENDSS